MQHYCLSPPLHKCGEGFTLKGFTLKAKQGERF
jgi:hypothetical protein